MTTLPRLHPVWRRLACCLLCGLAPLAGVSGPPPHDSCIPAGSTVADDESSLQSQRLVRRLSSGKAADRDEAERRLVALGPACLPFVTAERSRATGEPAYRLDVIEQLLERQATEDSVEPAVVTLQLDDVPAQEALRQLFARTVNGIEIAADARTDQRVSIHSNRLTFWETLDDLLPRAGLEIKFVSPPPPAAGSRLQIGAIGPAGSLPIAAAGPLRVAVVGVAPTPPVQPHDSRQPGARIVLRVMWEPRLRPVLARLPARSLIAEGPAGEAMPAAQRAAVTEASIGPRKSAWVDLPILLGGPSVPLDRLGSLRGTITVWLTGWEHVFCFPGLRPGHDPLSPMIRIPVRTGDVQVELLEAGLDGERLRVRSSVTYDEPSPALESHHGWLADRRIEAWDDDGTKLDQFEQEVVARTDRGIIVAASFAAPPAWTNSDPARRREVSIRWRLPIAIHEVPVDFAIRDIPLPVSPAR